MRTTRLIASLGIGALAAGLVAPAAATPVYRGKVSLSGFYYTENDGADLNVDATKKLASLAKLGYGDLRATVSLIRIAREKLDVHIDFRLRVTGDFNYENKFANIDAFKPDLYLGTSARGYLGGKEYDLREAYLTLRATESLRFQLGRFFVSEADNTKLDGLRVERSFGTHWVGSAFAGGYANPYSRSLLTDYEPPCGAGVAGVRDQIPAPSTISNTPTPEELSTQQCSTEGLKLGIGAGVGARYSYQSLWGNVGLLGSFFLGPGDGGPVMIDPDALTRTPASNNLSGAPYPNLLGPDGALDKPRIFLSWLNSWRPAERVDLMSDLVIDAYGSGGPQLTRAVLLGTVRLMDKDRLTLRVGYSHLSSLAIAMYLNRLVYNRRAGTTLTGMGLSAVENNLTVLRTGRDEARVTLDSRIVRKLGAFVEGRFRYRTLLGGDSDPDVFKKPIYTANTQNIAGDVSVGLRDTGSIAGIRAGLSYSGIFDYRATNHVISLDIGREFWNERISATLSYVAAITRDKLAGNEMVGCLTGSGDPSDKTSGPYYNCFGQRSGMTHEVGVQGSINPFRTLFFLVDYRLIATTTDGQSILGTITPLPTIMGHSILGRIEYRW